MNIHKTLSDHNHIHIGFEELDAERFIFLKELGFTITKLTTNLISFQKSDIEVDIFYEQYSYEVGLEVLCFGSKYSISDIIRYVDPESANNYRNISATTRELLVKGLLELSQLLKKFGLNILRGDLEAIKRLEAHRKVWVTEYSLDTLAEQLRPKADEAFRQTDYATAADLYERIRPRLSPAELKKLDLAKKRGKS